MVAGLNLVEFVLTDSELAEMAPAQFAGRQMVRLAFLRSRKGNQATGAIRLKTTSSKLSPTTRESDRVCSLVLIRFVFQKLPNLSFALSQ